MCVCVCVQGVAHDPGINQRALRLLFSEVTEKAPDWEFSISVSMVEIYNESLRCRDAAASAPPFAPFWAVTLTSACLSAHQEPAGRQRL